MPSASAPRVVRPFPWGGLEATTRAAAVALSSARRWADAHARLDEVARALGAIVKAPVRFLVRRAEPLSQAATLDGSAAVLVAPEGASGPGQGVILEAEAPLAAALVARALDREPPALVGARDGSPVLAGALAAVVRAAARRAHADVPLRVLAAGPGAALARDLVQASGEPVSISLTVLVADDAFLARALVPRTAALHARSAPWTRTALHAMGGARLGLPVVASASFAAAREVGSLAPGDAWVPGNWRLTRSGPDSPWTGPVLLAAPRMNLARAADLVEGANLVLRGMVEDLSWVPPQPDRVSMTETDRTDVLVESMGEVPVVVRVEIGTAEMRAREWAALREGDVIPLGRAVAEPVVLRVGGVELARGELVEMEGEVAVRILSRIEESKEAG
jgi:type III secretion protein Q